MWIFEKLRVRMAATIEKAKSTDPRELQKTVAELRAKIQKLERAAPAPVDPVAVNNAENRGYSKGYTAAVSDLRRSVLSHMGEVRNQLDQIFKVADGGNPPASKSTIEQKVYPYATPAQSRPAASRSPNRTPPASTNGHSTVKLQSGARRMLIALAQHPKGLTDSQLGLRAQISVKGGSFDTYLSALRTAGLIDGPRSALTITEAGRREAGDYTPLPSGRDLLDYYLRDLGWGGASRMLRVLADRFPETLDAGQLGELANVSVQGGSFDTYLSKLRTLELISGPRNALKASEEFFL